MGLSLEFYAGDAAAIGADFTAIEFDGIRDRTRAMAYADFFLHLSPTDFDILSEIIAESPGAERLLLNECLTRSVGGTGGESGADLVFQACVQMVAAANEADAPDLTADWIEHVGSECGQSLEVSAKAIRAVKELTCLCRICV